MPGLRSVRRPRPLNDAWFRLRMRVAGPRSLALYAALTRADDRKLLARETEACIEGFPRSGNTFAVRAFREWNPGVPIAHHLHLPGQLVAAAGRGLPAALVIRDPLAAVASLLVFEGGRLSAAAGLAGWVAFHSPLLARLDDIVICPFEDVVADPGCVPEGLNLRFGTGYAFEHLDRGGREGLTRRVERTQRRRQQPGETISVPGGSRSQDVEGARALVAAEDALAGARDLYERILGTARSRSRS